MRVFADRLIDEEDKELFASQCLNGGGSSFLKEEDLKHAQSLIFCNFVDSSLDEPTYMEAKSNDMLRTSLARVIEEFNKTKTMGREKMNVLLFDYFLQHLARVSRIIAKPNGNGLLIGLGGNGRKTIAKIATFINECQPYRIELRKNYGTMEWLDDLRNLYKSLGIDNKKIVFSFSDRDIKKEQFIEDINNILNVGELTSLFAQDDVEEIHYEIEKQLKKARIKNTSQEATAAFFQKRCKRNLHLLLFMSPAGTLLQSYFRKYPSLVNCTSIDWFLTWPNEALKAVSDHYLLKMLSVLQESTETISPVYSVQRDDPRMKIRKGLETITEGFEERDDASQINTERMPAKRDQSEQHSHSHKSTQEVVVDEFENTDQEAQAIAQMSVRDRVSQVFTQIHQSAMQLAEAYLKEKKRQVYVTPVMFMGVFDLFEKLLSRKNDDIDRERSKYDLGVRKLEEAKVMIEEMEEFLTSLKPSLIAKQKEVEKSVKRVDTESKEVLAVKEGVDAETEEAEAEKREANSIREDCQQKLSVAQPFFDKAIKALRTLENKDFVQMKSYQNPPMGVRLALEACCIMLGIAPTMKKVEGQKVADYWDKSKKLITNYKKLIDQLENYPKENIDPVVIQKIQPYLQDPNFQPEVIKGASEAAEGLCKWTIAICKFNEVYKEITPKRLALEEAEEKVRITQAKLQAKQEQLSKLQEQLAELQAQSHQLQEEKQDLLNKKQDAENKLERAKALMESIGSEKDRWIETKKRLAQDKLSLLGDMVLATCFVNYLGPFEGTYRLKIVTETWEKLTFKYRIKTSEDFKLKAILGEEEKLSDWAIGGLPNETTAFENMIIVEETMFKKYPVIIDPQGQAFQFLKDNMGASKDPKRRNLGNKVCVKASSLHLVAQIEAALRNGYIVFVENAGEVTNPHLVQLLRKEILLVNGEPYISFNDNTQFFDPDFRLFIFTQLSNPHYSPEVQQIAKVLNFSVTREGLEQQLLQIICHHELNKEETERQKQRKESLMLERIKKEEFDKILTTLRESGQEILESDGFVKTLNQSKETTNDIMRLLKKAERAEDQIRAFREKFESTAKQGARLYFAVQDLQMLDDMYQFSMDWFKRLFNSTFKAPEPGSDEEEKQHADNSDNSVVQQPQRRTAAIGATR